jgi:hypothetical protein
VPKKSRSTVNWQPIGALPLVGSMIDGLLDEAEKQYANLEACRSKPHMLDDYTAHRVTKVYSDQVEDLDYDFRSGPMVEPGRASWIWGRLTHSRVLGILKNPSYAGCNKPGLLRETDRIVFLPL